MGSTLHEVEGAEHPLPDQQSSYSPFVPHYPLSSCCRMTANDRWWRKSRSAECQRIALRVPCGWEVRSEDVPACAASRRTPVHPEGPPRSEKKCYDDVSSHQTSTNYLMYRLTFGNCNIISLAIIIYTILVSHEVTDRVSNRITLCGDEARAVDFSS